MTSSNNCNACEVELLIGTIHYLIPSTRHIAPLSKLLHYIHHILLVCSSFQCSMNTVPCYNLLYNSPTFLAFCFINPSRNSCFLFSSELVHFHYYPTSPSNSDTGQLAPWFRGSYTILLFHCKYLSPVDGTCSILVSFTQFAFNMSFKKGVAPWRRCNILKSTFLAQLRYPSKDIVLIASTVSSRVFLIIISIQDLSSGLHAQSTLWVFQPWLGLARLFHLQYTI